MKEPKKSVEMQDRARKRIPGGTQLLSKRPEMFAPGQWLGYYSRAKGIEVWDLDGNKYVDMSINAPGACVLGYADLDGQAMVTLFAQMMQEKRVLNVWKVLFNVCAQAVGHRFIPHGCERSLRRYCGDGERRRGWEVAEEAVAHTGFHRLAWRGPS